MGKSIKELLLEADDIMEKECNSNCNECRFNKEIQNGYDICDMLSFWSLRCFNKEIQFKR